MTCQGCGGESIQDATAEMLRGELPGRPRPFWRRLGREVEARIGEVAASWMGTPYMAGQQARGAGVDCVQLIGAMFDELHRRPSPTKIARLRGDTAAHDVKKAFQSIRTLRKAFDGFVVRDRSIEPGDVIVCRATHDQTGPRRPGHVLIAMPSPFTALHAVSGAGVIVASLDGGREILRVYRPKGKTLWA